MAKIEGFDISAQLKIKTLKDEEREEARKPVPTGTYKAMMIDSKIVTPKNNDGYYIACQYKITDGEFTDKLIKDKIWRENSNEDRVQYGNSRIVELVQVFGVNPASTDFDTKFFHFKPICLNIVKGEGDYGEYNLIRKILPADGSQTAAPPVTNSGVRVVTPSYAAASQGEDPFDGVDPF